ncbi:gluconate 2-dehydrogenase subunit 3 family protein [Novosphingobium sp. RD2P27]|uniref:Gluconate 2-dehydrogenase subunit 3 family protein n=1 Tax=Novosphingobium kalidii TaxID=3230299 RepID=A0ABV2D3C7_9SPHN
MTDRFRNYDVLAKHGTPSWDAITQRVIDERLALSVPAGVLEPLQLATLEALVARICPDPPGRARTTTVAMVVHRIAGEEGDGARHHRLPPFAQCWRQGLDAIEEEAKLRFAAPFSALGGEQADEVLRAVEHGDTKAQRWAKLPARLFWTWRIIPDLVSAHWSQPSLWSAMGFGGPASPRGYVRTGTNRRDPWEAVAEGEPYKGVPRHRAG